MPQELGRKDSNKLKKPSAANPHALSSSFSSNSASAQKQPNHDPNVYDPTAETIATASQKRKRRLSDQGAQRLQFRSSIVNGNGYE